MREDEIWISNRVKGYFADRFGRASASFDPATDVRCLFRFDEAGWTELADRFNRLDWAIGIHVLLERREMRGLRTIADLAGLICDKYRAEKKFASQVNFDADATDAVVHSC